MLVNYNIYKCDRCSNDIEEAWPMVINDINHYCYECGFLMDIIDSKEYLRHSGFGLMPNIKAAVHNGEVVLWTTKKPPWETPDSTYRKTKAYRLWRKEVFERDGYVCRHCGSDKDIQAHHIKPFAKYKKLRFKVSNGLTLCDRCHKEEHKRMKMGGRNERSVSNQ
ncbi:HNH endonuclease [Cohnella xylanilytica]